MSAPELNLDVALNAVRSGGHDGISAAVDRLADFSASQVPVRTGHLRKSRATAVDGLRGAVGYRDNSAVAAHENMHVRYRHGKKAKFLEDPLNHNHDELLKLIADGIREKLK